jgi:hypothetical protein
MRASAISIKLFLGCDAIAIREEPLFVHVVARDRFGREIGRSPVVDVVE